MRWVPSTIACVCVLQVGGGWGGCSLDTHRAQSMLEHAAGRAACPAPAMHQLRRRPAGRTRPVNFPHLHHENAQDGAPRAARPGAALRRHVHAHQHQQLRRRRRAGRSVLTAWLDLQSGRWRSGGAPPKPQTRSPHPTPEPRHGQLHPRHQPPAPTCVIHMAMSQKAAALNHAISPLP